MTKQQIEKYATRLIRIIGWVLIMVSTYNIGGIWWMLLIMGLISWLPAKYF